MPRTPASDPAAASDHADRLVLTASTTPEATPVLIANNATRPAEPTRFADATDGVKLAIYEYGSRDRPTALFVHGFPDDHTVWEPVIALAVSDYHVVTYDVRGTGASGQPANRNGYAMSQLRDDLAAVISATSPEAPVHLIAHDWGSIQSWSAATDPSFADRLASFTSISGPSLDIAGIWLRQGHRHPRNFLRQLARSWYIFAFQVPFLPEALVRRGVVEKMVSRSESIGVPADRRPPARRRHRDAVNGIELYRANFRHLLRPRPDRVVCPVQVLAPTDDAHVTVPLGLEAPQPFVDRLHTREIPGNHWVVEQNPTLITTLVTEFINTDFKDPNGDAR
ncbi:alpha/beta fold hydrolase [Mycobacterium sp. ITM-2016-00317]|uniref:alpha/beta fold hydrolase n=1 Tax=Mycobacterium sp. ITM-2016-00317 TaxID=2099694 RepID=UPI00287F4B4C|nr:alpha/beta fold hydrolase [Mycobacterium sp. ITM-2016-00317]WNG88032.1 alpha/beta fold hydrolase [Mycobacterium sp. ITM-2016-00317]